MVVLLVVVMVGPLGNQKAVEMVDLWVVEMAVPVVGVSVGETVERMVGETVVS